MRLCTYFLYTRYDYQVGNIWYSSKACKIYTYTIQNAIKPVDAVLKFRTFLQPWCIHRVLAFVAKLECPQ